MFTHHYQPIKSLNENRTELHIEALFRCEARNLFDQELLKKVPIEDQFDSIILQLKKLNRDFLVHFNVIPYITVEQLDSVYSVCLKRRVDPANVVIEVLEIGVVELQTLKHARNLGFKLALDDFGKGSSIENISTDFFFDFIKFDRSFLQSGVHLALISSLINDLQHFFPLTQFVLEGVESIGHYNFCKTLPLHYVQGFYLSKPLTIEELYMYNSKEKIAC
ncbi:EAL domain-containing protein [Pseudoalteromonas luteoviolacea]|uniref:EAL domain-containing protein n=1 Tax=Pseudoalteromonas luteoviolacea S4060-1 TaxID=1365257 RepID=A0A167KVQ5_9GAMM|nr:EAL domain-containing protein [Pseudoalteromonas luteoviolacea]KZN63361.1 hypothetical protein N478_03670 [Pseudoalteromonas luteoviolacea S4060-1]